MHVVLCKILSLHVHILVYKILSLHVLILAYQHQQIIEMANVDFFNVKLAVMFFLMLLKSFVYDHNVQ